MIKNVHIHICLLLSSIALLSTPLVSADIIVLSSGSQIQGSIEDIDADPIRVMVADSELLIPRDMIVEIVAQDFELNLDADINPMLLPTEVQEAVGELELEEVKHILLLTDQLLSRRIENMKPETTARHESAIRAITDIGEKATPILVQALKGRFNGQENVLKALFNVNATRGQELAINAIDSHENPRVREQALRLLSEQGSAQFQAQFESGTTDSQGNVRAAALQGLADTGEKSNIPFLVVALDDPAPGVVKVAQEALKALSPDQTFQSTGEWRNWAKATFGDLPEGIKTPVSSGEWTHN